MKCKKCGANLEIDNAFCPYCGVENPVAKKHREDMNKYAGDYKKTKEEVLNNSRRFNRMSFKIAFSVVTVAMAVLLVVFSKFNSRIASSYERHRYEKESVRYEEELKELMAARDYLAVSELISGKHINVYYGTPMYKYMGVRSYSLHYSDAFGYILTTTDPKSYNIYYAGYIADDIGAIYSQVDEKEYSDEVIAYINDLVRDTGLLLKTYLGLTDEEIAAIPLMTDAQRNLLIEEAYNRVYE